MMYARKRLALLRQRLALLPSPLTLPSPRSRGEGEASAPWKVSPANTARKRMPPLQSANDHQKHCLQLPALL